MVQVVEQHQELLGPQRRRSRLVCRDRPREPYRLCLPRLVDSLRHVSCRSGPNKVWASATPSGSIELTIDNPGAQGFLVPGKAYIIDIREATPEDDYPLATQGPTDAEPEGEESTT